MRDKAGITAAPAARWRNCLRAGKCMTLSLKTNKVELFAFDVRGPDHLGPLLGFVGHELSEVGRRTSKRRTAEVGKPIPDPGIGNAGIDFLVELINDLSRRLWVRPGLSNRSPHNRVRNRPPPAGPAAPPKTVVVVTARARSLPRSRLRPRAHRPASRRR